MKQVTSVELNAAFMAWYVRLLTTLNDTELGYHSVQYASGPAEMRDAIDAEWDRRME